MLRSQVKPDMVRVEDTHLAYRLYTQTHRNTHAHKPTDIQMHIAMQTQANTNMYIKTRRDIQYMQTEIR